MRYAIWSIEHNAWWRPGSMGYTDHLSEAGHYGYVEAVRIVDRANLVAFHECMIPLSALAATPRLDATATTGGKATTEQGAR